MKIDEYLNSSSMKINLHDATLLNINFEHNGKLELVCLLPMWSIKLNFEKDVIEGLELNENDLIILNYKFNNIRIYDLSFSGNFNFIDSEILSNNQLPNNVMELDFMDDNKYAYFKFEYEDYKVDFVRKISNEEYDKMLENEDVK